MGSDTLCRHLGVGTLPEWVTNLAMTGVSLRESAKSCGRTCSTPCRSGPCWSPQSEENGLVRLAAYAQEMPVLLPVDSEEAAVVARINTRFIVDEFDDALDPMIGQVV